MFNLQNVLIGLGISFSGLFVFVASACTVYYRRRQWLETKGINESLKELIEVMGR